MYLISTQLKFKKMMHQPGPFFFCNKIFKRKYVGVEWRLRSKFGDLSLSIKCFDDSSLQQSWDEQKRQIDKIATQHFEAAKQLVEQTCRMTSFAEKHKNMRKTVSLYQLLKFNIKGQVRRSEGLGLNSDSF